MLAMCTVCHTFEKMSEVSCDTLSSSLRHTGIGQDLSAWGHIYCCDLCGSPMMETSAREGCDPPE